MLTQNVFVFVKNLLNKHNFFFKKIRDKIVNYIHIHKQFNFKLHNILVNILSTLVYFICGLYTGSH